MMTRRGARTGWRAMLAGVAVLALCAGCPPTPPCDRKVHDPAAIEAAVRTHPLVVSLQPELTLRQVSLNACWVGGQVAAQLMFVLPSGYSRFEVIYADTLTLGYTSEGALDLPPDGVTGPAATTREVILARVRARVAEVETNPRVAEFLERTTADPLNPVVPLGPGAAYVAREGGWVEYNWFYHDVRGYLLPNDRDWPAYPEIALAHRAIEDEVLVPGSPAGGDLAACRIGRAEPHAYTTTMLHDQADDPWRLTVAVQCPDGWRDVGITIGADGSTAGSHHDVSVTGY